MLAIGWSPRARILFACPPCPARFRRTGTFTREPTMIDKLIGWSLRYRVIVVALAAAFLVWGGFSLRDVPLDVLPDLSAPTVTILEAGHGMAPTEMESLVTFPIEASLN